MAENRKYPKKWFIGEKLKGLPRINTLEVLPLQGSLKDLNKQAYNKLKYSLFSKGFCFPLFVWLDPETETYYTLDGHQRCNVINKEWPAGKDVPYIEISAANRKEAKEMILLIDSKYGVVTKDGFDEFTADLSEIVEFIEDCTTYDEFLDEEEYIEEEEEEREAAPTFKLQLEFDNKPEQIKAFEKIERLGLPVKLMGKE